jgi:hypothetical protein
MKKNLIFKEFLKNVLEITNTSYYYNKYIKKERDIIKKAYQNYKNDIVFSDCDEEKILKIMNLSKRQKVLNFLNVMCSYVSKDNLKEIEPLEIKRDVLEIESPNCIQKLIAYIRVKKKNIKDLEGFELFLERLKLDFDKRDKILTDDALTLEKLRLFSNDLIEFATGQTMLLSIIKRAPIELLQKINKTKNKPVEKPVEKFLDVIVIDPYKKDVYIAKSSINPKAVNLTELEKGIKISGIVIDKGENTFSYKVNDKLFTFKGIRFIFYDGKIDDEVLKKVKNNVLFPAN